MGRPIPNRDQHDMEELMTQPQAQQPQQTSTRSAVPASRFVMSNRSIRTVAFSLLVDRALDA